MWTGKNREYWGESGQSFEWIGRGWKMTQSFLWCVKNESVLVWTDSSFEMENHGNIKNVPYSIRIIMNIWVIYKNLLFIFILQLWSIRKVETCPIKTLWHRESNWSWRWCIHPHLQVCLCYSHSLFVNIVNWFDHHHKYFTFYRIILIIHLSDSFRYRHFHLCQWRGHFQL